MGKRRGVRPVFFERLFLTPSTGAMLESKDYDEWDYTRRDGKTVLLVLNEDTAEIFADLPDAFITIDLDSKILVDGKEDPDDPGGAGTACGAV